MFTRERHRRGVLYFGPYANAKKVRETLDVSTASSSSGPARNGRPPLGDPCLDFHIERCHACVGYISEEYRAVIERDRLPRRHEDDRARATGADARRGHRRALRGRGALPQPALRDREPGRETGRRPARPARSTCWASPPRATAPPCRCSRSAAARSTAAAHLETSRQDVLLLEALRQYFPNAPSIPPQIVVPPARRGSRRCRSSSRLRGSRVECGHPRRGSGGWRSWRVRMPGWRSTRRRSPRSRRSNCGGCMRSRSCARRSTSSLPLRIECFDISNIQGQEIVGSMVVFQDGIAKRRTTQVRGAGARRPG